MSDWVAVVDSVRPAQGDVETLLERLHDAAPQDVFDLGGVQFRVTRKQGVDQRGRHVVGARVAEAATLGTTHRGAREIYYDCISRIQTHLSTPVRRLPEEGGAAGGHLTQFFGGLI